jgi:anti-anti-sigma regulatory factor
MDSGGLGELVRCHVVASRAQGTVKLVNLTSKITDLLAITKLLNVFDAFDNEAEALASYNG